MRTDALSDLVRSVGDDSPAEHRAIFHLWSALDEIADGHERHNPGWWIKRARAAQAAAATALGQEQKS